MLDQAFFFIFIFLVLVLVLVLVFFFWVLNIFGLGQLQKRFSPMAARGIKNNNKEN